MPRRLILVIKHGALGDIIQGLDGYASLRAGHSGDHLAVLTSPAFESFFRSMPWFDEVIVDHRASPFNIIETLRMRSVFRRGWDRIYDFQSSKRTARYFAHFVPQGVETVGVHPGASHRLPDMSALNNRDRMLQTAVIGGCPETAADTGWIDLAPKAMPERLVVLVPGCSPAKPEKRWPAGHYAELALLLIRHGCSVALAGTKVDREVADTILAQAEDCIDDVGKTTLPELASLLASSRAVIGNDTGPVFMAARLGAPTVMLMSRHTDPTMSAPYGPSVSWLKEDAISSIAPETVFDHLKKMNPDL